jgi:hypothetical protein
VLWILLPETGGCRVTDFLSWWADHWPLAVVLILYIAWTAPAHYLAWTFFGGALKLLGKGPRSMEDIPDIRSKRKGGGE